MACVCPDESCTQIVIGEVTYCDCLVSQTGTCPDGSELVDIGGGVMVCRTVVSVEPLPCGIITCDVANGYVYNPDTQKCEKRVSTDPCPPGYEFVPTDDGVGKCQAVGGGTGELVCPDGYTYYNGQCTKITSTPAAATVISSGCKADIVVAFGITNSVTPAHQATFMHRFIDNIATGINSVTYDYRVGVVSCDQQANPYSISMYSGNGNNYTNAGGTASATSASAWLKQYFPTPNTPTPTRTNSIAQGLTVATRMLYQGQTNTGNSGPGLLSARTGVRKIIVLITDRGPTSVGTYTITPFGLCNGANTSTYSANYPQYAPLNFTASKEMSRTINQAKCLLANNPALEIFVVNIGTAGDPAFFGGKEGQFYFDVKSAGSVYNANPGNAVALADTLTADFLALAAKTNAPAVCGNITINYACPIGQTLVGDQCQALDVQNASICNAPCNIVLDGDNARCVCPPGEIPTSCGTCPVVNNKCSCTDRQNPVFVPVVSPISLDDPKYFDKIEWTISYDPKNKMWISFHDWHPTLMIPAHSHFFTINGSSFWKHNERFDSFTSYYNSSSTYNAAKDRGWEVEYNIVTPNQITTFRSVEYYMEAYKYFNDGKDAFHVLDENFDRAMIYNSEQVSPLLYLRIKDKNNPLQSLSYPIISSVNTQILASKEENKYRFNNFYDITRDRGEFSNSSTSPMFITAPDGYHKTINPAYVDVFKAPLQHKKFRHFGNKIVLRKTKSGDKKMLLKLVNSKMLNSQR